MSDFKLDFSKDSLDILDKANKILSEEIADSSIGDWLKLKYKAAEFLSACYKYQQMEESNLQNEVSKFIGSENGTTELLKAISAKNWSKRRMIENLTYLKAFQFNEQLTLFRNQVPRKIAYVMESENGSISTYILSTEELALTMIGGRVGIELPFFLKNRNFSDYKDILINKNNSYEDEHSNTLEEKKHISHATAAYMGTIARLSVYYNQSGGKKINGYLMYKQEKEWIKFKVLNKGDIKEAYVAALMTKHNTDQDILCKTPTGEPDYYSDEIIRNFAQGYISKVDSLAAIVHEDIVAEEAQYGVKSIGAAPPSLNQYYKMAQYIVNSSKELTQDKINEYLEKYSGSTRNKIIKGIESTLKDITVKNIDDTINILKVKS